MATVTLDYLLPELRFRVGDYQEPYRYADEWLLVALNLAAKKFQRYNKSKYVLDSSNVVSRNTYSNSFTTDEAVEGVIEKKDEYILIVLSAYLVLEGSLENSAWNTVSWKDAEISFSNLESGRLREGNLEKLIKELDDLILAPTKRLATPDKQSLPGYKKNQFESEGDY